MKIFCGLSASFAADNRSLWQLIICTVQAYLDSRMLTQVDSNILPRNTDATVLTVRASAVERLKNSWVYCPIDSWRNAQTYEKTDVCPHYEYYDYLKWWVTLLLHLDLVRLKKDIHWMIMDMIFIF